MGDLSVKKSEARKSHSKKSEESRKSASRKSEGRKSLSKQSKRSHASSFGGEDTSQERDAIRRSLSTQRSISRSSRNLITPSPRKKTKHNSSERPVVQKISKKTKVRFRNIESEPNIWKQ